MLASTVQFSNNNPNTNPTPPLTHKGSLAAGRPGERNTQKGNLIGPLHARPLRTQQRTYGSSPTSNPFQLTPTKEWTTTTPKGTGNHVVLDIN
jgi:hypothetical protein